MKNEVIFKRGAALAFGMAVGLAITITLMNMKIIALNEKLQESLRSKEKMMKHVYQQCPTCTFSQHGTVFLPSVPELNVKVTSEQK